MTPEHSPRSIARRTLLYAGVIVVAVALFLLLLGPRVWARGQINLFGLEVVRSWTETPLNPGQDACSPGVDAATGQRMQARLEQAADYDPHASLHQGAAACLQGDLPQAEAAWAAGIGEHPYDLMMSLFAAVTAYADGRMIETPYSDEIGRHGHKQCVKTDRTGDIQAAIDWCEFAFAYTPNKTTAGKLASLYERLGDESGAQAVWLRLQETLASSSPDYWWALGQSAEQEKDWPAAADAYQRGAALAGEKDAFRYSLRAGLMWLRAKDYAGAESVYRQALALNPDRVDAYLGLGDVYRSQKQYEEAVGWYEKAREVAPEHPSPPYQLGLVARAQSDYEEALAYFDRSLELRPDNPSVLYDKALALDALQRREEALAVLGQAIVHHKNPPQSWQDLQERWRRYPDYAEDPERWREKALAAEKEQDWSGAAGLYAEAASHAVGEDAYAYLLKQGFMWLRSGDYERAEATYRRALALEPEKLGAYFGVGESFRYRKEYAIAEEWYLQAMAVDPNNYRPPYHLGIVLYNQQRYDEALELLDRSLTLRPNLPNPWPLYFRAVTLKAMDRPQKAITALEQAIAAHKTPPESWMELLAQWQEE